MKTISFSNRKKFMTVSFFALSVIVLAVEKVHSRPEYAIKYGFNRCTVCHVSPAGGGPRTIQGKYFGAFRGPGQSWLANTDVAGLETKFIYTKAEDSKQVRGGMGVMLGTLWASIPIQELTSQESELRLVAEQNLGGFNAGPRQWYARWKLSDETFNSWMPQYILFGRIIPPFGLMTDEHRAYVRLQSGTSWNQGLDNGIYLSANPFEFLHYDFMITNGQKNAGTALANEMADIWGGLLNLRYISPKSSIGFGLSHSYYPATSATDQAIASSLYTLISFHRMSHQTIPVTLLAEFVLAENWNSNFSSTFVSDTSYATLLNTAKSRGYLALLEWDMTEKWIAQYKFDQLEMNKEFPSDAFVRHGVGVKYYTGKNIWWILRYEKAIANAPSETRGLKTGAQDNTWFLLNFSI